MFFRYDLKDNDIILADLTHENLIEDMMTLGSVEYTAGGAGLNSLRCAQVNTKVLKLFLFPFSYCWIKIHLVGLSGVSVPIHLVKFF